MAWMRLTLTTPIPGAREEVLSILNNLENAVYQGKGFIMGGVFTSDGEVGRFSLWETQEEADSASSSEHVIALRSHLHNLIEAGHVEQLSEISGANHNIPKK